MGKLSNAQKIELILADLDAWLVNGGDQSDDSLVYARQNGFDLHAASLWLGTGAMSDDVAEKVRGVHISRAAEMREIKQLCAQAYIYICPNCNHHGFLDSDEGSEIQCFSCGNTAKRDMSHLLERVRIYDNGGKTVDRYTADLLQRLFDLAELRKECEREERALKATLKHLMGGRTLLQEGTLCAVRAAVTRTDLDKEALRLELGDRFNLFEKQSVYETLTVRKMLPQAAGGEL